MDSIYTLTSFKEGSSAVNNLRVCSVTHQILQWRFAEVGRRVALSSISLIVFTLPLIYHVNTLINRPSWRKFRFDDDLT